MPRPTKKQINPTQVLNENLESAEDIALRALMKSLEYDPREIIRPLESPDQIAEERETLAGSLRKFIPAAWRQVEPSPFVANWHIDAIAEHLEAVKNGDIKDLLITMPPRHAKSLIVAVLYPDWEWIDLPSYRWVFNSYSFSLSVRDSIKRRQLIKSEWFQARWGNVFSLTDEQDTKSRYSNDRYGFMMAASVSGSNTGEGGERLVADDPHNVKEAESEIKRQEAVDWWNVVMPSRRNEVVGLKASARIVVQQRVHEGDVAGDIIEKGNYVHLNLPTEFGFAGTVRCFTKWTDHKTGSEHTWQDPRVEDGELLNPIRFDKAANEQAKLELGDFGYAAQHGQNPTPPSGTIIKRDWLKYYGGPTDVPVPDWTRSTNAMTPMFSLDCAFKELKDTDYVAGLAWAVFGADIYLMPLRIHARLNFPNTVDAVLEFVGGKSLDGSKVWPGIYPFIKIKLVEAKANGSAIIDTLQHRVPGMVPYEPGNASKESRLQAVSWRFRAGNVYLPHESIAPWILDYRYELCAFPKAKKDDYVDATSQALLFIGGDPSAVTEPLMTTQDSVWTGMGDALSDSGESRWGHVGGHSTWRIH